MERLLTLIALAIAACASLLPPVVTAYSGHRALYAILQTEVEINSRLVSQLINANPELWWAETHRLENLLERRPGDHTPEARLVLDLHDKLVAGVSDPLPGPLAEVRLPVFDAGEVVGHIVIQRSLRPLLERVTVFSLIGLLLGAAIFAALKLLPLRALSRAQDLLRHQATHDTVTGLPNRALFLDRLEQAMERTKRTGRSAALMFIDLDKFKDVNDTQGHDAGDELLRHVAERIDTQLREKTWRQRRSNDGTYTLARFGGDEFTVVIECTGSVHDISVIAGRILESLRQAFALPQKSVFISGSIGITIVAQEDGNDRETLLRQADLAMYRAKAMGGDTLHFYEDGLNTLVQERVSLNAALRVALEREEFLLHFQPKADLASGRLTGFEALLRWQRPHIGLVPPNEFIGALEESRLIVPVGAWVLAKACEQLAAWDRAGLPALKMAVNLSARQFHDQELANHIEQVMQRTGIAPQRLEVELTESLLMEDSELSRKMLDRLSESGVKVAIDDFGTGHSSLSYLRRFKVDTLKIDRAFVQNVPDDTVNCAISTAVTALAQSMGLEVVCEGIENREQATFMTALGCNTVQGFLLGKPMPADIATEWIRRYCDGDPILCAWRTSAAAVEPDALPPPIKAVASLRAR